MKIAQVSPLFERVPPIGYGGTERIISYLTEELVAQGHEVTLFASGDSLTRARLVAAVDCSMRPQAGDNAWLAYHTIQMDMVAEQAASFDVIHFHNGYLHFPMANAWSTPHVTTLHGRLDLPELQPVFRRFERCPLVAISDSQQRSLPQAGWCGRVHHGLPADLYSFQPKHGNYFVFIGRISPEKRLDRAIEIAQRCGMRLYIGAKVDSVDVPYFNEVIKPLLRDPLVEFVGEVGEREKRELLEHATALLFPIDWPEPFGLVMIEAFCCGTPVIAYRQGSVPEVMEDGVTGFVVTDQEQAVRAAQAVASLDRKRCREVFEQRFTATRMAQNYLQVYRRLMEGDARQHPASGIDWQTGDFDG
ncbi:glycosyltransferase family 4 protein [Lacisediminimonas sp.]|uniref:glycosyltransferase family 4 protein n=1 Tax=Lacisediminimonas sp. TaxID=3060582 RepID=UPI0027282896|nr:glycosyltransferase family 4 protein [Lacisediminimonas sp.]MDO8300662.1 glycosyltransferase family 4 protein [Lacisediminimonas sp.]MDO9218020.1 glycosyltransferase family 4 protein [Lacisediminimonas sp.]